MEDKQLEAERMAARQKEQQQSYMAHWRVKMNPTSSALKAVVPLPLEGAPDKFNPKTRRSSAPAGMQLRFKIDKKKSGNPAPNPTEREQPTPKPIPLRTSASIDGSHPAIYVIGPGEETGVNPISPRAKPTSPREHVVRHTPYTQTARSSRRHSIHTIESDCENEPTLLHLGTYSTTSSPSLSPRSSPTSSGEDISLHRFNNEPGSVDAARDSFSVMSDTDKGQEKLPSLQSMLADTLPNSALKHKSSQYTSPVDQEMSKLINKFLIFESKPAKTHEVTFAPTPMDVHYPR